MYELAKIFKNPKFGELQVIIDENGELWFVAADVCKILEITNARDAVARLDDDEKNNVVLNYGIPQRGNPTRNIVNEFGFYSLVLSSRTKEAKAFKRWVTHEVIPSIRKYGSYTLTDEQRNKITFAEQVSTDAGDVDIQQFAAMLNKGNFKWGRNKILEWMRQNNYIMRMSSRRNRPYKKYIEQGLFKVGAEYTVNNDGTAKKLVKIYLTPAGQVFFANKIIRSALPLLQCKPMKLF